MSEAVRTQRLGAYAVVLQDEQILLTRISPLGYPAGTWTLPGGGVDHGESPHDAVRRELYEETGLEACSVTLADVHDIHVMALGRGDQYEDYHGVHLLYVVDVVPGTSPHVVEVGGTTDIARWVPLDEVPTIGTLLPMVDHVLANLGQFSRGV